MNHPFLEQRYKGTIAPHYPSLETEAQRSETAKQEFREWAMSGVQVRSGWSRPLNGSLYPIYVPNHFFSLTLTLCR